MQWRVRFVSWGGPVEKRNPRDWPTDCGHKHRSCDKALECLLAHRQTTCDMLPLGAGLQYRFAGTPWRWVELTEEKKLVQDLKEGVRE